MTKMNAAAVQFDDFGHVSGGAAGMSRRHERMAAAVVFAVLLAAVVYLFAGGAAPVHQPKPRTVETVPPIIIDVRGESFATPGALDGTDTPDITPGWYAAQTPTGPRRYLVVGDDAYKQVARFVSSNVVHSQGDELSLKRYGDTAPLIRPLFYGDQPLRLMCGMASHLTCDLMLAAGYQQTQYINLNNASGDGHVVAQVLVDGDWVMVDADYGKAVADDAGRWLSIHDIADALESGDILHVVDLSNNKAAKFPRGSAVDTQWEPSIMQQSSVDYLDMLAEYTHSIKATPVARK